MGPADAYRKKNKVSSSEEFRSRKKSAKRGKMDRFKQINVPGGEPAIEPQIPAGNTVASAWLRRPLP
jgi:hypothetical protein